MPSPIDIFELDPELGAGLDRRDLAGAPPVERLRLERGPWCPEMEAESVGLLVTAGLLVRWIGLGDRWDPELLGPTDILRPWDLDAGDAYDMIPTVVRWRVLERVEIAVLGRRFARWAGGHPAVVALLLSRMVRRAREQSFRLVVQKLPLVSSRLHFLLWHFADRFGRMTPDGVLVEMKLPQDMLASMVNSRRQAVSGALAELREQGLIS